MIVRKIERFVEYVAGGAEKGDELISGLGL